MIADHGRTCIQEESPIQYIGVHWMEAEGNCIYSRYPPGLPVIIAIFFKLFGPEAGILVNYFLTTLTLLGLFVLCSIWIGKGWALAAVATMACNPVANSHAMQGDAHNAAAFFLIWGLVFLARWSKSMSLGSAFLAGLLLGYIPAIRYPEALFGLGITYFILFHRKNDRKAWPSAVMAIIGAMIPIVCLLVYNQIAFGAVWKTAYSLTNERIGFSLVYFSENIGLYLKNILVHGAGLLWILGMAGLVILCVNGETRKQGVLFIVLVLPITLLYMSYYFMSDSKPFLTMRFLLPTFYIYCIAGFWGLKIVGNRWKRTATATVITLLVVNTLWGAPQFLGSMLITKDANLSLAAVEREVSEKIKPGSIIIAPLQIQQHLDYLGQWRLVDEHVIEGLPSRFWRLISAIRVVEGRVEWLPQVQRMFIHNKGARYLMIIPQHINRIKKMLPYMPSYKGDISEDFLNELDRLNSPEREIYWIGKVDKIKDKVPPDDRLSVIQRIEPPKLLSLKFKEFIPNSIEQPDLLNNRFRDDSSIRHHLFVNSVGIILLTHQDMGLELVKWTRVGHAPLTASTTLSETKPGLYVNEMYRFSVTYPEFWEAALGPNP
ncbi:ArnT family glycosyltransferase, partial [Thermodesulfobacteriota bacterium]